MTRVFTKVCQKFSDTKLIIMGVDFGYQKEMELLIEKLNLSERIVVIKNPPREYIISAYGESEFLVFPSQWELSPLTPLESFAFKKPVISTNSHGTPYVVKNNENGILVEAENSIELAKAIIRLLDDNTLKERLGMSGYQFVHEDGNCISMANNTLKLYMKVLESSYNK